MATSTTSVVQESIVIKLDAATEEVNAAAVASTMQAMVAILEEAQRQIQSNETILIKARPFNKGSFEIPFELIFVGASLAFENHPLIEAVLNVLARYISLRKATAGKSVSGSEGASLVVRGDLNAKDTVVNIINNSVVNIAFDKAATDIQEDKSITGLHILRGKRREPIASIERDDLRLFKYDLVSPTDDKSIRQREVRTTLIIHTPVLEGRAKWKFIYDGHTITAEIQDEEFMSDVQSGREVFAAGDRLDAIVAIQEEYARNLAAYTPKKYVVATVFKHTKRPATDRAF